MSRNSFLMHTYRRENVQFVRGADVFLFDESGRRYLDFLSGIAVTNFGHRHGEIRSRVIDQLERFWHVSNLFASEAQENLARDLCLRSNLDKAFFCNSGTEANEAAIKFARKWGGSRWHIIAANGGFHGRTLGSLAATGQSKYWAGFEPLPSGFDHVPYGNSAAVSSAIRSETVAVMVEPIQGENGIIVPPENYLRDLRTICDRRGLLLIVDEVQTGMGRTGKMLAHQWYGIRPDIVTLAKGIANGLPLGATLCTEAVSRCIQPGDHGSTFGGNPLSVAAALGVVDQIHEDILEHVTSMGEFLRSRLRALPSESVADVRGKGLMIGLTLQPQWSAQTVARALLEKGILVGASGEDVIRILPPFTIRMEHVSMFLEALSEVLALEEVAL